MSISDKLFENFPWHISEAVRQIVEPCTASAYHIIVGTLVWNCCWPIYSVSQEARRSDVNKTENVADQTCAACLLYNSFKMRAYYVTPIRSTGHRIRGTTQRRCAARQWHKRTDDDWRYLRALQAAKFVVYKLQ